MTILGIDIGGSGIKGAPVDLNAGRLVTGRFRIETPEESTPAAVAEIVERIRAEFDWHGPIGCTVPARVENGRVRTATNIHKTWKDARVEDLFGEATGIKVSVLNDADAAGIASVEYGAARGRSGLVIFLTVGTGIGTALLMNGVLVPNSELGHIKLKGDAAELYVSDRTRSAKALTWSEWAARFQKYLDRLEFLLAPQTIIIGGGIARPEKAIHYMPLLETRAELLVAELQNEAGIIGAALYARGRIV